MAKKILILFLLLSFISLTPHPLAHGLRARFVVWNVGQGQWVSRIEDRFCLHFDAGGEYSPLLLVRQHCAGKTNLFFFSHWDWDHLSFASSAHFRLSPACILNLPPGVAAFKKQKILNRFQVCESRLRQNLVGRALYLVDRPSVQSSRANDLSQVIRFKGWLIPGDAPIRNERLWAHRLSPDSVRILLLGHHGSQTSTSNLLLNRLSQIRQAIASSRRQRYGHPHIAVKKRLHAQAIPLVSTEEWGHLLFMD
ncbi:MAG: hydrolase [Bdellovibrionales bacterium]